MAVLNPDGSEVLDQTPVSLPIHYDRPEPIHMRLRRMILEATASQMGNDVETLEDANDFEIPDDPSSYDTTYTEPDLEPAPQAAFTDAEIAAAREAAQKAIEAMRAAKDSQDEAVATSVSSDGGAASEPAG